MVASTTDAEFLASIGIIGGPTPPAPRRVAMRDGAPKLAAIIRRHAKAGSWHSSSWTLGVWQNRVPICAIDFDLDVDKPVSSGDLLLCADRLADPSEDETGCRFVRVVRVVSTGGVHVRVFDYVRLADRPGRGVLRITSSDLHTGRWYIFGVATNVRHATPGDDE